MTTPQLVRSAVMALRPYTPGTTVDQARERYGLERIVKLSSNENPWGSSPKAIEALQAVASLHIYVNDEYRRLREKLAAVHGVSFEGVVLGHGSNELLALAFLTFVEPGEEIVMAVPTFSLYRSNALMSGAVPVEVPLLDTGVHDLQAIAAAITPRTKMVMICDPNNPTGTQVELAEFEKFIANIPDTVLLVLDQAYREYAYGGVEGADLIHHRPNTIVLRTASKVWGLAALRFGFALTSPEIAGWMARVRLPFNVSLPALAAVEAALDDQAFIAHSVGMNTSERARLTQQLEHLGLTWYVSQANFLAVKLPMSATQGYEALLQRGIIVRSGDGLRMPGYLRITIGTPEENDLLLAALSEVLLDHASKMQH